MRSFKVDRHYYNDRELLFKKANFELDSGLTILVGCNGTGKSTILKAIKRQLEKEDVPVIYFNNLLDGGHNALGKAGFYGDMTFLATAICSSEGEQIILNMGTTVQSIGSYIRTNPDIRELWILLDAVDSGLSIDNILDIKDFFKFLQEENPNIDIHVVAAANEYELCNGENCFDVTEGKYLVFKNYEEYRKFIIKSREKKDKRFKKKG